MNMTRAAWVCAQCSGTLVAQAAVTTPSEQASRQVVPTSIAQGRCLDRQSLTSCRPGRLLSRQRSAVTGQRMCMLATPTCLCQ
jgi:hypothetical protein